MRGIRSRTAGELVHADCRVHPCEEASSVQDQGPCGGHQCHSMLLLDYVSSQGTFVLLQSVVLAALERPPEAF